MQLEKELYCYVENTMGGSQEPCSALQWPMEGGVGLLHASNYYCYAETMS